LVREGSDGRARWDVRGARGEEARVVPHCVEPAGWGLGFRVGVDSAKLVAATVYLAW